jgi:exonuclease III
MAAQVCTRARLIAVGAAVLSALAAPQVAHAQATPATFKVAFLNIQSGKGEPALSGHTVDFSDTTNCTDAALPLNAWGIGLIQDHLRNSIGADSRIVALGLAESWASVCGSPENVRKTLGWAARSSERNGVAMVARYGFAGAEEWVQLDTTLNDNPSDTMWVLRVPVCLDSACSQSINLFAAHWFASGSYRSTSYDRQAQATAAFLQRAAGSAPHVLVGDLNVWEGVRACGQNPTSAGLSRLRDIGYVDAWPAIHGAAEGFTGMTNRSGCGVPQGYTWKRIDYAWSPGSFQPLDMQRWAIVTPGDGAPSDHYGIVAEYPWPGAAPVADTNPPSACVSSPIADATVSGTLSISIAASDDVGVSKVEVLEDGVVAKTLTAAPYQTSWDTTAVANGTHTVGARAYDAAGNVGSAAVTRIYVQQPVSTLAASSSAEIVLYAKNASLVQGNWTVVADAEAAGGARVWNRDAGAAKLSAPLASPASYVELTFDVQAGTPYRLWIRGRAERNYWGNDSVFVQFSGSVDPAGSPTYRIGTTIGATVNLEDCSGCGISGWGWQDNGYGAGVLGPLVSFATTGYRSTRSSSRPACI